MSFNINESESVKVIRTIKAKADSPESYNKCCTYMEKLYGDKGYWSFASGSDGSYQADGYLEIEEKQ